MKKYGTWTLSSSGEKKLLVETPQSYDEHGLPIISKEVHWTASDIGI